MYTNSDDNWQYIIVVIINFVSLKDYTYTKYRIY